VAGEQVVDDVTMAVAGDRIPNEPDLVGWAIVGTQLTVLHERTLSRGTVSLTDQIP